MPKLSDSQLVVLTAACQRPDRCVFPVAAKLTGNAAGNVLKSLLKRKLLTEVRAKGDQTVWRQDKKRGGVTLVATNAAFPGVGISDNTKRETKPRGARQGSKQASLIEMLRRPKGATIDEIAKALSWQPHTVRGAIAGTLKKKLGFTVVAEKSDHRGRVYRITG